MPKWLTDGLKILLQKTEETKNRKNYRPITCLPTMYKVLTSILADRTYTFLSEHQLLPSEQKGCRRESYGCKDQRLVNKMILEDCRTRKKNLSTAWIDYKAFDSVPHSWIMKCMEIYKICPVVTQFITAAMRTWKPTLVLNHPGGSLTSRPINIKSGIFQGDSLSPLLFCMALAPLSPVLQESGCGYEIQGQKINHLFFMDDLKTYSKDDNQQAGLLTVVKKFKDNIRMEFGLEKCAKATFKRGKLTKTSDLHIDTDTSIRELDQEEAYKYLGINKGDGIQHATMKEKVRKEYYRRVRLVLKSELNPANRFEAVNTLAVPVVTYSFNITNWKMSEIKRLDTKTWKLLTIHRMHHPKADVNRMYLPRRIGGRGLTKLETAYKSTTIALETYLRNTDDALLQLVLQHETKKKLYSIQKEAEKFKRKFEVPNFKREANERITKFARRVKQKVKQQLQDIEMKQWEEKELHGRYPER